MGLFDPCLLLFLQLRSQAFVDMGVLGKVVVSNLTGRDLSKNYALPKLTLITALKSSDCRSTKSGLKWR